MLRDKFKVFVSRISPPLANYLAPWSFYIQRVLVEYCQMPPARPKKNSTRIAFVRR